jgi:hypothetical protein
VGPIAFVLLGLGGAAIARHWQRRAALARSITFRSSLESGHVHFVTVDPESAGAARLTTIANGHRHAVNVPRLSHNTVEVTTTTNHGHSHRFRFRRRS